MFPGLFTIVCFRAVQQKIKIPFAKPSLTRLVNYLPHVPILQSTKALLTSRRRQNIALCVATSKSFVQDDCLGNSVHQGSDRFSPLHHASIANGLTKQNILLLKLPLEYETIAMDDPTVHSSRSQTTNQIT